MRLWHYKMIPHLPQAQLMSQHRECAALRGNGWGKKHSTVDYVFNYSPFKLYNYHCRVMLELSRRGVNVDLAWFNPYYRGVNCRPYYRNELEFTPDDLKPYPEHNTVYFTECILNLMSARKKDGSRKNKVLNPMLDGKGVMK